jgi:hypothetical protein
MPLTPFERFVKVPIGFLWLLVLAVVAVPVILYMTALAYAVDAARTLRAGGAREGAGGAGRGLTRDED